MATCALCEKKFKDRRGLHGHFRFVHGIEYGSGRPAKKTVLTEATREILERKRRERELIDRLKRSEDELSKRKALEFARELEEREIDRNGVEKRDQDQLLKINSWGTEEGEPEREEELSEGINLEGIEPEREVGISLKALNLEGILSGYEGISLKGLLRGQKGVNLKGIRRWY